MAEEEFVVVVAADVADVADPNPTVQPDHKRKLEDLEPGAPEHNEPSSGHIADLNAEPDEALDDDDADVAEPSDESQVKRPRLDDKSEGSANENGYQEKEEKEEKEENEDVPVGENAEQPNVEGLQSEDAQPLAGEVSQTVADGEEGGPSVENPETGDAQQPSVEDSVTENAEDPSKEESQQPSTEGSQTTTRKMEVPNNKVGVLIGKAGDTIRYLQYNSGAKIQITRDMDADPYAATRPVEIIGTLDNINKAEKLISAVIAEADAGGSPSLIARGLTTAQAAAASEQIQIQVPNEKVGLIIGRGGETIKGLQTRTGARIQLIPQHLPEGDESKERTVRVTGDKKQIEMARELIKEVMSQFCSTIICVNYPSNLLLPNSPGMPMYEIIFLISADFELVGFKNADLAIAFSMGSALLSWCSNRQPLFTLIHKRKVSGIKSQDCRMLIVGYPEQAAPNNAAYGYQGPQDPAYSGGPASAYSAPPSGQPGYAQPAPTQQSYDQSIPQAGGYGSVPASAPVAYGKTVSPQPAYTQYDTTQMYGAPR
ncbi:far upstream element-binding protein 1-like isoform X2 [Fagus crenata]